MSCQSNDNIPLYTESSPDWTKTGNAPPPFAVGLEVGVNEYIFGRTTPDNKFVVASGLERNPHGIEMIGGKKKVVSKSTPKKTTDKKKIVSKSTPKKTTDKKKVVSKSTPKKTTDKKKIVSKSTPKKTTDKKKIVSKSTPKKTTDKKKVVSKSTSTK